MTTPAQASRDAAVVADLDRRFHAFVVDRMLGWSLAAAAGAGAWFGGLGAWGTAGVVVASLLLLGLASAVLLGVRGATPGKAACGLRVVDVTTGTPIGIGRALLRQLVLGLGTLPLLGLGAAVVAWTVAEDHTRERRGWHDHRAGSVVVDVRPRADAETADERPRHIVNLTAMRLAPAAVPAAPAPAPAPSPAPRPATSPMPPRSAGPATTWRVTADSGESLLVEGVVLVGRDPVPRAGEQATCLLPLRSEDMSISKTHAQFHAAPDGALVVTDRGATNGTVLVRQGMSRELSAGRPATLLDGDRVRVGDREIRVSREAD